MSGSVRTQGSGTMASRTVPAMRLVTPTSGATVPSAAAAAAGSSSMALASAHHGRDRLPRMDAVKGAEHVRDSGTTAGQAWDGSPPPGLG